MRNDRTISAIRLQVERPDDLAGYIAAEHPGCILWPIEFGYDVLLATYDGVATCRYTYVVAELEPTSFDPNVLCQD